jgi:hypothetical protein
VIDDMVRAYPFGSRPTRRFSFGTTARPSLRDHHAHDTGVPGRPSSDRRVSFADVTGIHRAGRPCGPWNTTMIPFSDFETN